MRRGLNKKAVSPIIGYILLIGMILIVSTITFQWVKTYIPKEALQCPDGVSMFIQKLDYNCSTLPSNTLNLTLKNNGRFNISGYFIRASQDPNQIATYDLSYFIPSGDNGRVSFSSVDSTENSFGPRENETENFIITTPDLYNNFFSYIEIVPIRYEEVDNKLRLSSCSDARIQEILCPGVFVCVPEDPSVTCGAWVCGTETNNCGTEISCPPGCTGTDVCSSGSCVPVGVCGDGVRNQDSEQCDDDCLLGDPNVCEPVDDGDGCSSTCQIETLFLGYFGFEGDGTGTSQGWSISETDSELIDTRSNVSDDGTDGGLWSLHIKQTGSILQNFDFTGFKTITIDWWGFYETIEDDDCVNLSINSNLINSWGETGCTNVIIEDSWISQSATLTDTQYTFSASDEIKFEGIMNQNNDHFYIDGINITGKKY